MLSIDQMERAHRLWDQLADFAASETDEALNHLMAEISQWLAVSDVVWIGAVRMARGAGARRDPQNGWRGMVVRHLCPDPAVAEKSLKATREQDVDPGLTTRTLVASAGSFRVHRLHDGEFVNLSHFKTTAHYRVFYEEAGIRDRMFVGFPLNDDAESFFLFDRMHGAACFTPEDAEVIGYIMRGLKWFHRELLLSHGLLLAQEPLSATERRIVQLLLTERSEKEIASKLGQSPTTTHKYITTILRKYGVRGRTGLMALWLGRSR